MAQNQGTSGSTQSTGGMAGGISAGMQGQGSGNTGVDNTTFNVISVVYHALQGAETIQKYLRDSQGQDQQVEQFLREAQEQNKRLAQRGQECLQQMLQQHGGASSGQQMQGGWKGGQQGSSGTSGQQSQGGTQSGGGTGSTRI